MAGIPLGFIKADTVGGPPFTTVSITIAPSGLRWAKSRVPEVTTLRPVHDGLVTPPSPYVVEEEQQNDRGS